METNKEELLHETIQEITLAAWPLIYGENNPFDLDSRMVLSHIRQWAEEFEKQWKQREDPDADYLLAVEEFAEKKAKDFIAKNLEKYMEYRLRTTKDFIGETVDGATLDGELRNLVAYDSTVDIRNALGESALLCVEGKIVPQDFFVDSVIRASGGIILYGYWDDPVTERQTWDALLLANVRYYPKHSDNLVDALRNALKILAKQ